MKDVFICHASEDKEDVVLPIVEAFEANSISYWLDQAEINWGDSLIEKINDGLSNSRFVIVVISDYFLSKKWPQKELNAVLNIEASTGDVKVLPLLVGESINIQDHFMLMNDKLYLNWSGNPLDIVTALKTRLDSAKSQTGGMRGTVGKPEIRISNSSPVQLPKDQPFSTGINITEQGVEITGGELTISAEDGKKLLRVWIDVLPELTIKFRKEHDETVADELAFIGTGVRAFSEVYNAVPSEQEMKRGSSILSRKLAIFVSVARDMTIKARERNIDLEDYVFSDRSEKIDVDGLEIDDPKLVFYRNLLHAYVLRVCNLNSDLVETIEAGLRHVANSPFTPEWEKWVEDIYDITEEKAYEMYQHLKGRVSDKDDEELAMAVVSFYISQCTLEDTDIIDFEV